MLVKETAYQIASNLATAYYNVGKTQDKFRYLDTIYIVLRPRCCFVRSLWTRYLTSSMPALHYKKYLNLLYITYQDMLEYREVAVHPR